MRYASLIIVTLISMLALPAVAEVRLMMVEEEGCPWCERWNRDVGGVYDITEEGKFAPLWRYHISDPVPEGITFASAPHYTPTFILLVDGTEVNRIEGYPGEAFFWGLLDMMLTSLKETEVEPSET
ncbi:MAG: hypothetical protein AAED33_07905 [Paracoccaceae bacterium]